jgi:hypothetical protein
MTMAVRLLALLDTPLYSLMRQRPPNPGTEAIAVWPEPAGWVALVTGRRVKLISRFAPINWPNLCIFGVFWICLFLIVFWAPRRISEPVGTFIIDHPYMFKCCLIMTASFLVPQLAVHYTFQTLMSAIFDCYIALRRRTDSGMPYLLEEQLIELSERVQVVGEKRREMWGVTEDGKVVYGKWWLETEDTKQEEV